MAAAANVNATAVAAVSTAMSRNVASISNLVTFHENGTGTPSTTIVHIQACMCKENEQTFLDKDDTRLVMTLNSINKPFTHSPPPYTSTGSCPLPVATTPTSRDTETQSDRRRPGYGILRNST